MGKAGVWESLQVDAACPPWAAGRTPQAGKSVSPDGEGGEQDLPLALTPSWAVVFLPGPSPSPPPPWLSAPLCPVTPDSPCNAEVKAEGLGLGWSSARHPPREA